MPKVSVIVPVYNGEAHLRECLDSIKNQSLEDIEIICVDDGSTDSSVAILHEYATKDSRFRIYQQEHKFAGVARNLGKSHAKGEYLAFWDCDDFFELQALQIMYGKAKSVDADVCACGGNRYLESKQKLYPWPAFLNLSYVPEDEETFNRFTNPKYYLNFTNAAAWNKIFKREYIEKLGLDFQPIRNGNDVYFTENAIGLADRITVVKNKLINYRVNLESGLVNSVSQSPLSPIQAWIDIAQNLEKADGFGEQSFANKALGSMIYVLQNIQEWDAFRQAVEALQSYGLAKLHILPREDYYYNSSHKECADHLYKDSPEEFAVYLAHSSFIQKSEVNAERRWMDQKMKRLKRKNKQLQEEINQLEDSRSVRFARALGRLKPHQKD